jgi:DNA repair ATPase RecN
MNSALWTVIATLGAAALTALVTWSIVSRQESTSQAGTMGRYDARLEALAKAMDSLRAESSQHCAEIRALLDRLSSRMDMLEARLTRLETRLDEQDRTQMDRRRSYDRDAQDQARAVCGGIHECYFREPTGVRAMPTGKVRQYGGDDE